MSILIAIIYFVIYLFTITFYSETLNLYQLLISATRLCQLSDTVNKGFSMAKQSHPYHLVNPSPWPFVGAFSLLFMTFGGAAAFHQHKWGAIVALVGLVGVLYTMFGWWKDVVKEGMHDHAHTKEVSGGLRIGMALFIVSEILFFAAFFWAFFNASLLPKLPLEDVWAIADGIWPPKGIVPFDPMDLPFLNTLILLLSGTTVTWAHYAVLHGRQKEAATALGWTVFLGVLFTACQAYEYSHAAFGFKDGIYASTFFMATGFHGFHVIVGTLFLAVCMIRARGGHFTPKQHLGLEFAAWYWHFVDVVWLFLFVCVYGELANKMLPIMPFFLLGLLFVLTAAAVLAGWIMVKRGVFKLADHH